MVHDSDTQGSTVTVWISDLELSLCSFRLLVDMDYHDVRLQSESYSESAAGTRVNTTFKFPWPDCQISDGT
jgi:hypothetical protein